MKDKNNTEKATTTRARMFLSKIVEYGDKRPEVMHPIDFLVIAGLGHKMLHEINKMMASGVCTKWGWCEYHNHGSECSNPDRCKYFVMKTIKPSRPITKYKAVEGFGNWHVVSDKRVIALCTREVDAREIVEALEQSHV